MSSETFNLERCLSHKCRHNIDSSYYNCVHGYMTRGTLNLDKLYFLYLIEKYALDINSITFRNVLKFD